MIDAELLPLLACPVTRQPLRVAAAAELAALNAAIARGIVQNRDGERLVAPLDAALATADGRWIYPIQGGVPRLLPGTGIAATAG